MGRSRLCSERQTRERVQTINRAHTPCLSGRLNYRPFLEILEDRVVPDSNGPRILSHTPLEVRNAPFDHLDVLFSKAINAATFTPEDVRISGPVGPMAATRVDALSSDTFRVSFTPLIVRGNYLAVIGPNIADLDGNLMDQNQDGIKGDPVLDTYQASFVYIRADTIFTSSVTIGAGDRTYDGRDVLIDGATVTINGPHSFNSIHLVHGAVLTHSANTATQTFALNLTVAEQVILDGNSRIDVSGKGYLGGRTTGNTSVAGGDSGGSYGGLGGGGSNLVYGDYADPDAWGSGGGNYAGGAGGGLIRLRAQTLQLDGQILADGQTPSSDDAGGGSGGGIFVSVQTLTGNGLIRAGGGNGTGASNGVQAFRGGGGGGGRNAVYAQDFTGFATSRITAPGGTGGLAGFSRGPDGGAGTVHIARGQPHTHVRSYAPTGQNGGYLNRVISSVTLQFNKAINATSFHPSDFLIDGPLGRVTATAMTQVGDRTYRIDFPTQKENGPYHFTLLPTLLDVEGFPLDQNADGNPGQPDDAFTLTLVVDTVGPRVTMHTPAGDLAGTIDAVDVWFSEAINKTTFSTADVSITKPNGQAVAANSVQEVGLNRFRINFAPQTLVGTYHVKVGPDVSDLAGNLMDQNRDGIFGQPGQDIYDATFNVVDVDLGLNNLVVAASQLWAGESVTVSWKGANRTGAPLVGNWTDAVYLSADDRWDISDVLLTTVPHTGGLAQNQTYSQSVTTLVPGKLPGTYRILVRADVYNQEREINEANNVIASAALPLGVRPLPTNGSAIAGTLTREDRSDYYTMTVPAGQSLDLVLHGLAASGTNELYVRLGALPTRQDYDLRVLKGEFDPDGQDHRLALTAPAGGGTYYVLIYGDVINTTNSYTLSARTASVIVTGITPDHEGTAAVATVAISGAGFDQTTTVAFIAADRTVRQPIEIKSLSATSLAATVDLPTWTPGAYDVRVAKGDASDTLVGAFRVTPGGVARLQTNLIVPSAVGFNVPIKQTIWIEYRNTGDVAMPAPLLKLTGSNGARLTVDPALAVPVAGFGSISGITDTVQILGFGSSSTPWILQTGESERIPVYYLGLSQPSYYPKVTFSLGAITADDERLIDWSAEELRIRPANLDDRTWNLLSVAIKHRVGSTWGAYVQTLSEVSKAIYSASQQMPNISQTWQTIVHESMGLMILDPTISSDILKSYFLAFITYYQQLPGHDPCNPLQQTLFNRLKEIEAVKNEQAYRLVGIASFEFAFAGLELASLVVAGAEVLGAAKAVEAAAVAFGGEELASALRILARANNLTSAYESIREFVVKLGSSSSEPAVDESLLRVLNGVLGYHEILNEILSEATALGQSRYAPYLGVWTLIAKVGGSRSRR